MRASKRSFSSDESRSVHVLRRRLVVILSFLAVGRHARYLRRRMRELSSAPQGQLFEPLVPPEAERRGNQEFTAQLAHSPQSEAEGGTRKLSGGAVRP